MSLISSILNGGATLAAGLSQAITNGGSPLGTLQAPTFPQFLTNNPLPSGFPWGTDTAKNTNPYTQSPVTGVIRSYDLTISRGVIAPDGFQKSALLVNGEFPAPTIEANWGDTFQITVHNNITGPPEGTALHWHGILQKTSPWFDGVPSVQQCPIAPGKTFTYSFIADLYGTSWYHSHYSAQYAGGLAGAMIIHGPHENQPYDIDLGPVFLSDYYHSPYLEIVANVVGKDITKAIPKSDNNLINGKMDADCTSVGLNPCTPHAGLAKFKFTTGKTHRLRLINSGAEGIQRFSIDNHTLTVFANDFVPIVPYQTDVVTLGIGQRTDVAVTANGEANQAYWMRSDISTTCSTPSQPSALAVIYYPKANTNGKPNSTAWPVDDSHCGNDNLTETTPYYPITPAAVPATTQLIDINFGQNSSGNWEWTMNNSTFHANYDYPLLLLANEGNTTDYPTDWNVYNFGSNTSFLIHVRNHIPAAHPMHMHGHNFFVLAEGVGDWDGTVTNPSNPQRRDVQLLQPSGFIILQVTADNPGVWPFHCHIAWHVSAGLYVNLLERPADITQTQIPLIMAETCTDWHAFSHSTQVDEIDSGL